MVWFAGAVCQPDGKLGPLQVFYQVVLSFLADDSLDLGGILWLEHLNMRVGEPPLAEAFYCGFLGFVREPALRRGLPRRGPQPDVCASKLDSNIKFHSKTHVFEQVFLAKTLKRHGK